MDGNLNTQETILSELSKALKIFSLYGTNHPSSQNSIDALNKAFTDWFSSNPTLELAFQDDTVLISGKPLETTSPAIKSLYVWMEKHSVWGISFSKEIRPEEINAFLQLMSEPNPKLKTATGMQEALKERSITHIQTNTVSYIKAAEGVSQTEGAGEVKAGKKRPSSEEYSFEEVHQIFSKLKGTKRGQMITRLLEDPERLELIIQDGLQKRKSTETKNLTDTLCNTFIQKASRTGANATEVLQNFTQFKDKITNNQEAKQSKEICHTIQKTYDEIRVKLIASQFLQADKSHKSISEIAKKWIPSTHEMWRLIPQIKAVLQEKGLGATPLSDLLKAFKKEESVESKEIDLGLKDVLAKYIPKDHDLAEAQNMLESAITSKIETEIKKSNSELTNANIRLNHEKRRMENIFDNVSDGLIVTDTKGNIRSLNPAARDLLGLDADEKIDIESLHNQYPGLVIAQSKNDENEIELKGDAVTTKTLRQRTGLIRDENGNVTGSIFLLSDITRQRQRIKNKADIFVKAAFELHDPLTSTNQAISLLKTEIEENLSDEQKKLFDIMTRSVQRMSNALSKFKLPESPEELKSPILKQTVGVQSLLETTIQGMSTWLKSKEIQLDLSPLSKDITLDLDLDRFLDVLHAIIGLHIKSSEQKGELTISSSLPLAKSDVLEIHLQTVNPSELGKSVWQSLKTSQSIDDKLSIISETIGVKLSSLENCELHFETDQYQYIISISLSNIS